MATKVKVLAANPGYPGRYRAGDRHFLNGTEYVLEVVDDPPDGPPLTAREPLDPRTGLSSMTHISKAGLAELEADKGYIGLLTGDDAEVRALAGKAGALEAENAEMRRSLESAQGVFDGLREENAKLSDLVKERDAQLDAKNNRLAELEAQLAEAKGETKVDDKGDAKAKADKGKAKA